MPNQRLPHDVVYCILSELPVKSLLRFKNVSKEWYSFINNDLYFIKSHLRKSMESNRNLNIILKERESGKLFYVGFDSVHLNNPKEINHPFKRLCLGRLDHDDYDRTQVLGSCNGLLCLINEDQTYKTIVLWNISTGDYKVLSHESVELQRGQAQQVAFYGLGYDSINDDYKLVSIVQEIDYSRNPPLTSEVKVYNLKTNRWRKSSTEEIPYYFFDSKRTGTFVSGALHWAAMEEIIWGMPSIVVAFDVGTEKYRQIELLDSMENNTYNVVVGTLQGCLCIFANRFDNKVDVWMMKHYGVKESWTMMFSFQGLMTWDPYSYPLTYSKSYEQEEISLLWYDAEEKEFKDVNFPQSNTIKPFPAQICVESLVQIGQLQRVN